MRVTCYMSCVNYNFLFTNWLILLVQGFYQWGLPHLVLIRKGHATDNLDFHMKLDIDISILYCCLEHNYKKYFLCQEKSTSLLHSDSLQSKSPPRVDFDEDMNVFCWDKKHNKISEYTFSSRLIFFKILSRLCNLVPERVIIALS